MSSEDLIYEMGQPKEIRSFEEEKKIWEDGDFNTERALVYLLGFDQLYIFDYQNKYCLWKAYFKDNKLIYMNLSGRYVLDQYKNNLTVRNDLKFGASMEDVEEVLGKNFFPDRDMGYTDYLYADLGIRFTFSQNKIATIYLFRPFSNRADLFKLIKYYYKGEY